MNIHRAVADHIGLCRIYIMLFCHLHDHSDIRFPTGAGNFIFYVLLRKPLVRVMRTEYNIIKIRALPAQKYLHFPMNMFYIRYFTHSPCHYRLVRCNDGKITAFIYESY